jgi:hypothetical protein
MFLLQVAGAEAVWRCSAERSACRYSGTDLGLGHCGPDGLALRAPLIASACIHARRPRRFWVLPVRLRLILSTAVKPFATRQTSIACLVWQGQRFCETFQALGLASESILSDSLGLLPRFVGGVTWVRARSPSSPRRAAPFPHLDTPGTRVCVVFLFGSASFRACVSSAPQTKPQVRQTAMIFDISPATLRVRPTLRVSVLNLPDLQLIENKKGSSGRTRTYNPPVNSRMLCH